MTVRDDVLAKVDQCWRSAKQIHESIDCWALATVAGNLQQAAEEGILQVREVPVGNWKRHEYRLNPEKKP